VDNPSRKIECDEHGAREATYVCQHLVSGTGCGFHCGAGDDDPDELWPDAWCDACEEARQSEGGWNERSEALAAVRLICDACYEAARERNWIQDEEALGTLIRLAVAHLQARQDELQSQYAVGSYERYDWDQETGELVFSHAGHSRVVADIQFVGSVSTQSHTWLWSWANKSLQESVKQRVRQVRTYGEEHRHLKLASARWPAEEVDGWEMTAVAAYLLRAKGAYRTPGDRGFSFMVMTAVRWVQ
jgi:hypothetical protein